MAPQRTLVSLLSLAVAASAQFATSTINSGAPFWTYTSRLAAFPSPSVYTSVNGGVRTYTYTDLREVKPSVSLSATPTSTTTRSSYYGDLQIIEQYYPIGVVNAESDLVPERDYSATTKTTSTSVVFSMPVVMSAPASCPTPYTVTATATVDVPSQVWDQVKPTSTTTRSLSTMFDGDVVQVQTWYLSSGAAPFTPSSYMSYRLYVASCSTLPTSRTRSAYDPSNTSGSSSGGGGSSSSDNYGYCFGWSSYSCGTPFRVWVIILAAVIPGLFLLGFLESWFWFRRLMRGRSAMRFGTVSWVLISLWVLCFTRMQDARSKEDQKLLEEKWKNMGSGAAFKAWWRWGFRHKYPVEHLGQFSKTTVGIVPAGQPLYPAMQQMPPPMFTPGAPPPAFSQQPGSAPVSYYGPPPPGWVPTPDGQGFMPPQGYAYPPPAQQAGYYGGDVNKSGTVVSNSPVSSVAQPAMQPQGYPVSPVSHSPQQVYPAPQGPPPQGPVPVPPTQQASPPVSEVSEAPGAPVQRPVQGPPGNTNPNPNNRDLYD